MSYYKTTTLLILIVALYSACSKHNNPAPANNSTISIVGKWYYVKDTTTYYTTTTNVLESQFISTYNRTNYTQFNSDGTGTTITFDVKNNPVSEIFSYNLSNDGILTFNLPAQNVGGSPQVAFSYINTVKTLTNNNLILSYSSPNPYPGNARYAKEAIYFSK